MKLKSTRRTAAIVTLAFAPLRAAPAQERPTIAEVRSILREASALIPMIEESHRWVAAANIAAEQAEADDLDGALATSRSSPVQSGSVGGLAYSLAAHGRLPTALQIIAATPDGQSKDVSYWQVVQALLKSARYDDALSVARLISKDAQETDRFLDALLGIYAAQWKAGDRQGASATLSEALGAVEREPDIPPGMTKPIPTALIFSHRPGMYRRIVHAMVLAGNRDGALPVVADISAMAARAHDPDRKMAILGPLSEAQADIGDFASALRTAKLLKADFFGQATLPAIAVEQARQGNVAAALATTGDLSQQSASLALQEIARTLEDLGDYVGARAAVDRIQGAGERAYGLADLAFEQAGKDPAAARVTVDLAWKATQSSKSNVLSNVYQNALEFVAATRARLGDVAGALEMINGPDLQRKEWPLQNLVQFMVESGKKDDALALSRSQAAPRLRASCLLEVARILMYKIDESTGTGKE